MNNAQYICFEGTEGVGKTTQVSKTIEYLTGLGKKVLETKEPGSPHSPITLELRKFMLDSQFETNSSLLIKKITTAIQDQEVTPTAKEWLNLSLQEITKNGKITNISRELISQAIRNIHLNSVIKSAKKNYDYIIQDRGILSGLSYGVANLVSENFMVEKNNKSVVESGLGQSFSDCYDLIIILKGNVKEGLKRAQAAKQEFKNGDVMENKGSSFLEVVDSNFIKYEAQFKKTVSLQVMGKSIEEISKEIQLLL